MKTFNYTTLIRNATGIVGATAIISAMSLPSFAQVNPRANNSNQPRQENTQAPARNSATPTAAITPLDREFFMMAVRSNNAEIQTSQLALQRSNNQTVREYAQRMIQEHTASNQQLSQLASQNGFTLPNDVDPLSQAIAQRLSEIPAAEFDQAYTGAQATAHLRALALYQTQIQQGQEPTLIAFANQQLPVIADHYQVAARQSPTYRAQDTRPGMNHNMQEIR